jgi:hypothetical protein
MGKNISHMPAASLGRYASLSFIVIGRKEIGDLGVLAAFCRLTSDL